MVRETEHTHTQKHKRIVATENGNIISAAYFEYISDSSTIYMNN